MPRCLVHGLAWQQQPSDRPGAHPLADHDRAPPQREDLCAGLGALAQGKCRGLDHGDLPNVAPQQGIQGGLLARQRIPPDVTPAKEWQWFPRPIAKRAAAPEALQQSRQLCGNMWLHKNWLQRPQHTEVRPNNGQVGLLFVQFLGRQLDCRGNKWLLPKAGLAFGAHEVDPTATFKVWKTGTEAENLRELPHTVASRQAGPSVAFEVLPGRHSQLKGAVRGLRVVGALQDGPLGRLAVPEHLLSDHVLRLLALAGATVQLALRQQRPQDRSAVALLVEGIADGRVGAGCGRGQQQHGDLRVLMENLNDDKRPLGQQHDRLATERGVAEDLQAIRLVFLVLNRQRVDDTELPLPGQQEIVQTSALHDLHEAPSHAAGQGFDVDRPPPDLVQDLAPTSTDGHALHEAVFQHRLTANRRLLGAP
mmetsp:Transcript_143562/g.459174  ORF Transcript_143562/g.459174 Transcript_143562/m.459174 type:complete len:421 (+) Transcript_143562:1952-3214(+)